MFDYFGIISFEYNISNDKYLKDGQFKIEMEEAYTKIDLEFGDDTSTPLPENLSKKVCDDLLREK